MTFVVAQLLVRIMLGIALTESPFLLPVNQHALQRQPDSDLQRQNKQADGVQKIYTITFFSLKRGHSIAPGKMFLYDNGNFEIKIEGENLLSPQGTYTLAGYRFMGEWQFAIKRTKAYQYACQFKGLNVFDNYIVGFLTLREYIAEQMLTQEIPFIFFAVFEDEKTVRRSPKGRGQQSGRGSQTETTTTKN